MNFSIEINNVLPISRLIFDIDLSRPGIHCIVGKNGAGKTTLAKAIMNLAQADTFVKMSAKGIFSPASTIDYTLDGVAHLFTYDSDIGTVSTRNPVPIDHKNIASVEMPVPYGQRFTFFRTLSEQDNDIRKAVVIGNYKKPEELIAFLEAIYLDRRFEDLVEIQFRRGVCCCIVYDDKRYLREDYFSSGEYFLINLYRKITKGTRLVVIDEIDISLDASTQARLALQLRKLCDIHGSSVVFTSHSLAMMQTLEPGEIKYLERDRETGENKLEAMSFNGIKSIMFGFEGYDRYILTEDDCLEQFLKYVINRYCSPTFYSYQVICAGGQGYVKSLMDLNRKYSFYGDANSVMCVLDGDQSGNKQPPQVLCLPIKNVEDCIFELYKRDDFEHKFDGGDKYHPKALYKELTKRRKLLSPEQISRLICDHHDDDMRQFSTHLWNFLCR